MGKIHVAIIDDGIGDEVYNTKLVHNIEIDSTCNIKVRSDYDRTLRSHGTMCAGIIQKYSKYIKISSIKILDEHSVGDTCQLHAALNWCLDNGVRVANLSLGSFNFRDLYNIREMVNRSAQRGLIMVCSAHNSKFITYPASLSNVIGIQCDQEGLLNNGEYLFNYDMYDGIEFSACSKHTLIDVLGNNEISTNCNSFATPLITAKVCEIIVNNPMLSVEHIKRELIKSSRFHLGQRILQLSYRNPDWIGNAVIFSLGKISRSTAPYYFHVLEEISVADGELYSIIDKWLSLDKEGLADTIIIVDNVSSNLDYITGVNHLAEKYKRNIIYINDNVSNLPAYEFFTPLKMWHGSFRYNELKLLRRGNNKTIDIPVVFIYFPLNFDMFYFLHILKNCFAEGGYNASVVVEKSKAVLYDLEYIPLQSMQNDSELVVSYIGELTYKTNADIFICGLSVEEKPNLYSTLDIDIEFSVQLTDKSIQVAIVDSEGEVDYLLFNSCEVDCIYETFRYIKKILKEYN